MRTTAAKVRHNVIDGCFIPIVIKGGDTDTMNCEISGNLCIRNWGGLLAKSSCGNVFYNNTVLVIDTITYSYMAAAVENEEYAESTANNNIFKNNIFADIYGNNTGLIYAIDGLAQDLVFDNNVVYKSSGFIAAIDAGTYNLAEWQAEGYDINSYDNEPDLSSSYCPNVGSDAKGNGEDLGAGYNILMDCGTYPPSATTTEQTSNEDIGAFISE